MKRYNVFDCSVLELDKHHSDRKGNISVVENGKTLHNHGMAFIDNPLGYTDTGIGSGYYPCFSAEDKPYASALDHLVLSKNTNSAITLIAVKG